MANALARSAPTQSLGPGRSPRRGRPPNWLTPVQRLQIATLVRRHPNLGLPQLRQLIPDLPKNATADYLRRGKAILRRRRRRNWCRTVWLVPSTVWAVDFTLLDRPVPGLGRRAMIVVDVHSRRVLALESVPGERAAAVIAILQRLIQQHGAPLVLKADNGSGFIAAEVAHFCRHAGITLMHSPVRRPRWNGTCEVSGRWAKLRAIAAMIHRGSLTLTQQDLDAAVPLAGPLPPVSAELRAHFLRVYHQQLAEVAAEWGLANLTALADHVRRSLGRVAAKRALITCHILTIQGRAYRQWLPSRSA